MAFLQGLARGDFIPPVDPLDIKHLLGISEEIRANHSAAGLRGGAGISFEIFQDACSPGANVMAVWLRSSLIGAAAMLGALSDWQHGTELDDVVFRVAANIPLAGGGINPEAFVQRLQEETAG